MRKAAHSKRKSVRKSSRSSLHPSSISNMEMIIICGGFLIILFMISYFWNFGMPSTQQSDDTMVNASTPLATPTPSSTVGY